MEKHSEVPFEYNYIIDGIYIGTNQCCQTHFEEKLLKEGITADISLEEERIDSPFGVEIYVWIPVKDQTPPTQDQLQFGVFVLEKLIAMKKKVYIHCRNGHGRAPTLVAAYLIKNRAMTVNEALEFIKTKRPSIHLSDLQIKALDNFAKTDFQ
ncbi:MAG: hypothetical protein KatS3mg095_0399 [Candidatus Parcubacteria bacterium]|nr:MAG: hypothetical protein KatS3mg095_0399 [Candidatus Parcubacteria bacterium]